MFATLFALILRPVGFKYRSKRESTAWRSAWDWALFIGGWILQFVGHYAFEKNSPAFFRNLVHLLIGPLWVFARLTRQA